MIKKIWVIIIVLSLIIIPTFTACKTAPVSTQTITIGFNHIWPATSFQQTEQFTRYFKMVEEAAKGKYTLKIDFYPAGTLLGPGDIYDGVLKGTVDAGCSVVSYTPGLFPVMLTLSQSGVAPPANADANALTAWEFYNKYKPKEFDSVKVLYWCATPPAWLHSTTPVRKLEDIKGMDIRATGASGKAVTAVGGNPQGMAQPEVLLAAQKGIVKGSVAPFEVLMTYKQAEAFDYSTFVPFFYSEQFYIVMNMNKWNSFPSDLQKAFDDVGDRAVKQAGQLWNYNEPIGMEYAKNSPGGHELIYLSDAEAARWIQVLKPICDAYVAELNGKGFPGEEIVTTAGKIAEQNNKKKYDAWKP
jgi:TRAP-type C4-dicarboxylate transport system substrate-binding protein